MDFSKSSFGRVAKHKRFDYKPLYYDKDKDDGQSVRIDIKKAHLDGPSGKSPMSAKYDMFSREEYEKKLKSSRLRRMAILMLMMGGMYLWYLDLIPIWLGFSALFILLVFFIWEVNNR